MSSSKVISIPILSKGEVKYILVDEPDFRRIHRYRWSINAGGYAMARDEHGSMILLARFIMGFPQGKEVDHSNRNKLDNRRANLRITNRTGNVRNALKPGSNLYRGVSQRSENSYRAGISVSGKRILIGGFKTAEEAARAYNALAQEHHGEFAVLNDL